MLKARNKHKGTILMGRVTIQTIAERAGVSRGTVDRVLHDRPNVNPTVREHVQQIVRQLGYCEAKGESVCCCRAASGSTGI